jgi:hypothetical protein
MYPFVTVTVRSSWGFAAGGRQSASTRARSGAEISRAERYFACNGDGW